MPSKGVSIYSYISADGIEVEFSVPGSTILNTSNDNFSVKNLEVESHNIPGLRNFVGRFQWRVLQHGEEIASRYNDINSLSGNLAGGNMTATAGHISIVRDDVIISFGFYDAGTGVAGLTDKHQCWVAVSPHHSNWMGEAAPEGSPQATKPFSRFVIAAPHDNGMNSMQNVDAVLNQIDADMAREVAEELPQAKWFTELIPKSMLAHMLPNIIYGVAITQKDTITTMLELGARYFEFRPANLYPIFEDISPVPNKPYFQHACIPGLAFDDFLAEQVHFLDAHPLEIVTIHIRWDNIVAKCKRPTVDEIHDHLTTACQNSATKLTWGGAECFQRPIDQLRSEGRRFILVIEAEKYDSWTAQAYATLHAPPIIERFESMNTEGQHSTDLTILQCQATSQSIKEVLVYSVMASNTSTSCLSSTKAMIDRDTLPWIRQNALQRLQAEKTIVIMNDWIDAATTETSIQLSRERLAM